jgi:hypothetical protein
MDTCIQYHPLILAANTGASTWPASLSALAIRNERNLQMFLMQMRTFKETAEAYISGSALPDPKSLADLAGSLDAAKRPTLELPIASSAERDLARGVYRDLQEIRVLLTDTLNDPAWAGRKLRRMAQFWGVDYEQAGVPRPQDLDKLIAHVEALAQRLMGRAGASNGEAAVEHVERGAVLP